MSTKGKPIVIPLTIPHIPKVPCKARPWLVYMAGLGIMCYLSTQPMQAGTGLTEAGLMMGIMFLIWAIWSIIAIAAWTFSGDDY